MVLAPRRSLRSLAGLTLSSFLLSCTPSQPAQQSAAAETSSGGGEATGPSVEQPFPRTLHGEQPLIEGPTLKATQVQTLPWGEELRLVVLALPDDWQAQAFDVLEPRSTADLIPEPVTEVFAPGTRVSLLSTRTDDEAELALVRSAGLGETDLIWLLMPTETELKDVALYASFQPMELSELTLERATARLPLKVVAGRAQQVEPTSVKQAWLSALERNLELSGTSAMLSSLQRRVGSLLGRSSSTRFASSAEHEEALAQLMSLASGKDSVSAALMPEPLTIHPSGSAAFRPSIPLETLSPPTPKQANYAPLLRRLRQRVPPPALAAAVPHDYYFVHSKTGEGFFAALDEVERFLYPALQVVEGRTSSHGLKERYLTELGLKRGPLTRLFGPQVIEEVALIGSDPFVRMGSDLTLLLRSPSSSQRELLRAGLADALLRSAEGHGDLTTKKLTLSDREVVVTRSADGRVRRYSTELKDGTLVLSNSQHALAAVVETAQKRALALSDEPDFKYMWRRDQSVEHDVFLFAGEDFVNHAIAPGTRVLDARRAVAHRQLVELGYASILSSLYLGRLTTSPSGLAKLGLVGQAELVHFDGATISGSAAAASSWGRPDRMVSLIDLPAVKTVTREESRAYEDFALRYSRNWGRVIDPIALRLKLAEDALGFEANLRVMPVYSKSELRQLNRLTQDNTVYLEHPGLGLSATVAIGENSPLRREFSGASRSLLGQRIELDWLGDYALVGLRDTPDVAHLAYPRLAPFPRNEASTISEQEQFAQLPAYVGLHLRRPAVFSAVLALLKAKYADQGELRFGVEDEESETPIYSVELEGFVAYYATGTEHFFLSPTVATLRALLRHEAEGRFGQAAKQIPQGKNGHQINLEGHFENPSAFARVLYWAFESAVQGDMMDLSAEFHWTAQSDAIVLGRALGLQPGDSLGPEHTLPLLGSVPLTADGFHFSQTEHGMADPPRGSFARYKYPELPILDANLSKIVQGLELVRIGLSIEQEGPTVAAEEEQLESLRTQVIVRRRPQTKP